jgi:hypothetical protein
VGGAPAGWAPYSGQVPVLLQWTSGPDLNAYRGSLDELLALTSGGAMGVLQPDDINNVAAAVKGGGAGPTNGDVLAWIGQGADSRNGNAPVLGLPQISTKLDEIAAAVAGLTIPAPAPVDPAALKAVLLDPEVLAAIAKAVNDDVSKRMQA